MIEISYRLAKSFGYIEGHAHKHIAKGTVLVAGKDDALISTLHHRGAQLARIETEPQPTAEELAAKAAAEKAAAEKLAAEKAEAEKAAKAKK
jgi:hypothetical protein